MFKRDEIAFIIFFVVAMILSGLVGPQSTPEIFTNRVWDEVIDWTVTIVIFVICKTYVPVYFEVDD